MDAARDFLDCRLAGQHDVQAALEQSRHASGHGSALDAAVVGALKDQAFDLLVQRQELGDRTPG